VTGGTIADRIRGAYTGALEKYRREALGSPAAKALTAVEVLAANAPGAIQKVRRSPRRRRPWVAFREILRAAGRFTYGPLWAAGEQVVKAVRKA
jgi:hypothetical protein